MPKHWEQADSGLFIPVEPVAPSDQKVIVHAFVGEQYFVDGLVERGNRITLAVDPDPEKIRAYRDHLGDACGKARVVPANRITSSALFPGEVPEIALLMGSPTVFSKREDPTGRTYDKDRSQIMVFARLIRALKPRAYVLSPDSLVTMSKLVDAKGRPMLDVFAETVCRDAWTKVEALKRSLLSNREAFANYESVLGSRRAKSPKEKAVRPQQTEIDFSIGLNTEPGEATLF